MSADSAQVILDLKTKIDELTKRNETLTADNSQLTDTTIANQEVTEALQKQLKEMTDSIDSRTSTLSAANEQFQKYNAHLENELSGLRAKMQADFKRLEEEKSTLTRNLRDAEQKLADEIVLKERLTRDLSTANSDKENLNAQNDQHVLDKKSLSDDHATVKQALEKQLAALNSVHNTLKITHATQSDQLATLKDTHRATSQSLTTAQALVTSNQQQYTSALSAKDANIAKLTRDVDSLTGQLRAVTADLSALQSKHSASERSLKDANDECDRLKKREQELTAKHERELNAQKDKATKLALATGKANLRASQLALEFGKLVATNTTLSSQASNTRATLKNQIREDVIKKLIPAIIAKLAPALENQTLEGVNKEIHDTGASSLESSGVASAAATSALTLETLVSQILADMKAEDEKERLSSDAASADVAAASKKLADSVVSDMKTKKDNPPVLNGAASTSAGSNGSGTAASASAAAGHAPAGAPITPLLNAKLNTSNGATAKPNASVDDAGAKPESDASVKPDGGADTSSPKAFG